jgi:hypothetical protein
MIIYNDKAQICVVPEHTCFRGCFLLKGHGRTLRRIGG